MHQHALEKLQIFEDGRGGDFVKIPIWPAVFTNIGRWRKWPIQIPNVLVNHKFQNSDLNF
jgi:hypothetical protein